MITLDVRKYCENCRMFEPEAHTTYASNFDDSGDYVVTIVRCERSRYCENIASYLEKKLKGMQNDD